MADGILSPQEFEILKKDLLSDGTLTSESEAEELRRQLGVISTAPIPSRIESGPPTINDPEKEWFIDRLLDVDALVDDYGNALSSLGSTISEEYQSEAQQSVPKVLRPFTTAGGLVGKTIYGAGKDLAENPLEAGGRMAAQTGAFLANPLLSLITVPAAGELFDFAVDATSGDLKTPAEYGDELRRSLAFEGPATALPMAKPLVKGKVVAPVQSAVTKTKKFFTGEGDYPFERGERLKQRGRVATNLGAVDRNKTELATSTNKIDAESTFIEEGILQSTEFRKGASDIDIAEEIGQKLQTRISDYQSVENQLLQRADSAGVKIDVGGLTDPDVLRVMLNVPEGKFKPSVLTKRQFPVLSDLLDQRSPLGTPRELTASEANQALKEAQKYLRVIGAYNEKKLPASAQEALNVEALLKDVQAFAGQLNEALDTSITQAVDLNSIDASPDVLKPFGELNRRQHDLLIYSNTFRPNGSGDFITTRLGTESGDRINFTEPRGISSRIGNQGNFFFNAQEALGKIIKTDQANIKRGEIQADTLRMLEDAKLSAQYQSGQLTPPKKRSSQLRGEARDELAAIQAGKAPSAPVMGIGGATLAQEPIPQPAPTPLPDGGISPEEAGGKLSFLQNLLGPATANAEELPLPGPEVIPALQAAVQPQPIPRDPDIIKNSPDMIRRLMVELSPRAAQIMVDAIESKDPIKQRLAFAVALQENPDIFEPSVTGARSEVRIRDGFVLGDPSEIPLLKAKYTARFRRGEMRATEFAKQISALNDPTDQRLFPEPTAPTLDQELRSVFKRPASSPQEALSRATPKTINTPAGERRIYTEGATSEGGKPVNSNAREVAKALEQRGYSKAAIAGILGNLEVETGGSFDYQQKQVKGPAVGLFQFDFMKPYYKAWLEKTGFDDSLDAQVEYVDRVIKGTEPMLGSSDKQALQNALEMDDPVAIAEIFSKHFLKPGKPHLPRRKKAAQKYAALLDKETDLA